MNVFVDSSAIYAVVAANDSNHPRALEAWTHLAAEGAAVFCTNYVLLETTSLLQHRVGMAAVRAFEEELAPVFSVHWISAEDHREASHALLTANRRQLSLVDCTSFAVMRHLGIRTVFAFDEHFAEQGFTCLP